MTSQQPPAAPNPVMHRIFTSVPPYRLLAACCPNCKEKTFPAPRPSICSRCWGALTAVELSDWGRLHSFTVVRTKALFGLPEPYAFGYVDLIDDGLRIVSLLDPKAIGSLRLDQPVWLCVAHIGTDGRGRPCLRYYFSPQEDTHK